MRSTTLYSLSKPDDALGGRNASLVCNLSHAYHFYDCAPPPRLPSYAGPPCAPGTTHDSFSQVCACGRRHTARVAHGLCLLYTGLYLRGDRLDRFTHEHRQSRVPCTATATVAKVTLDRTRLTLSLRRIRLRRIFSSNSSHNRWLSSNSSSNSSSKHRLVPAAGGG